MTDTLATFRCNAGKVQKLLELTALKEGNEPFHDDVFLKIYDDRVETIMAKKNNSTLTNCTFYGRYFDNLDLMTGKPVGAIINVERTTEYLKLADSGGTVELSFIGEEEDEDDEERELAHILEVEGGLNTRIHLPTAAEVLEQIPESLPERFDSEDLFHSKDGKTHTTQIRTTIDKLDSIKRAVELDEDVDFYPVTVDGGEFTLEIGTDGDDDYDRTAVWGELGSSDVDGEDLQNWYNTGFVELINTLTGEVNIQASPGAPMAVVQDTDDDKTVRHVLAQVNMS